MWIYMRIFFNASTCLWPVGLCAIIAVQNARFGPIPPVFLPGINPTHHSNGPCPLSCSVPQFSSIFHAFSARCGVGLACGLASLRSITTSRAAIGPNFAQTKPKQSSHTYLEAMATPGRYSTSPSPTRKSCRHRIGTPLTA